jgi:hypothetical protein
MNLSFGVNGDMDSYWIELDPEFNSNSCTPFDFVPRRHSRGWDNNTSSIIILSPHVIPRVSSSR